MSQEESDVNLLRQRFATSVPDFENGNRTRHPFAARQLVVVFRRGTDLATIERLFQQADISVFRQERNALTYVLSPSPEMNRLQLFRKINRCREVRYVGPHRNRNG